MWRVLLREEMLCLFLPPPWIRHLLMLQLPLTKDRRSTQSERLRMCLGLPYICAGNTNAYTGRLVCSGLWKSLCKCTVRANIGGKITLLLFLFSPSLIGKFMSVHGIQRPLLLSHQAVLLGRGNAPKGSRPQEKDEMSFLHNAKSNWKCTWGKRSRCWLCRRLSPTCASPIFFLSKQESLAKSNTSRYPVAKSGSVGAQANMYGKLKNIKQLCVVPFKWECVWGVDETPYFIAQNPCWKYPGLGQGGPLRT